MGEPADASYRVRSNDFRALWDDIREEAGRVLEHVGASGWYVLGDEVTLFENEVATRFGVAHAVGCGNGLDALEIGLRVAGLRPGERVLTTPLSAFATTLAILRAGGTPVFVDVDDSGLIDLDLVDEYLANHPDVRFMLPVHLYGHVLDLVRLRDLTESREVTVVEDCAQAIGASWRGVHCGTVGAVAAVSFYPTKNLGTLGDGGALLTNDPEMAARARTLRDYGQTGKYLHAELGLNSRLDELHAALLRRAMLPRLARFTTRRREVAGRYQASIHHPAVTTLPIPEGSDSVWHLFPVTVQGDREGFRARLASLGIQTGTHYPLTIPDQPAMQSVLDATTIDIPRARTIAATEVSIPIHPYLKDDDVESVIDACNARS